MKNFKEFLEYFKNFEEISGVLGVSGFLKNLFFELLKVFQSKKIEF
jgi:hypothetical protein